MGRHAAFERCIAATACATDPEARGGELYTPRWVTAGSPVRRPVTGLRNRSNNMHTLWSVSENAVGIEFDVEALAAPDAS